jgi:hypothetical protein
MFGVALLAQRLSTPKKNPIQGCNQIGGSRFPDICDYLSPDETQANGIPAQARSDSAGP